MANFAAGIETFKRDAKIIRLIIFPFQFRNFKISIYFMNSGNIHGPINYYQTPAVAD